MAKLIELGVQPGDVVQCVKAASPTFGAGRDYIVDDHMRLWGDDRRGDLSDDQFSTFRIVSRDGLSYELPYGHARLPDGTVVDLTAITAPFGLLDQAYGGGTQEALKAHGGPYQFYGLDGMWKDTSCPSWGKTNTYRVATKPKVETVAQDVWLDDTGRVYLAQPATARRATLTFNRINGKIDLASYRLTEREGGAE